MTPSRNVALAVALGAGFTAGAACAAEPSSYQKKLAALASDEAAFQRAIDQARRESESARAARERQEAFHRLCRIKPVMTDPEIDGCRKAYKL